MKKCIDILVNQEHRRTKTALVTDINIPTGYRLFMNDTHLPGIGGIGFVISPRCSYKLISSEFFSTRIGKLVLDISCRRIHILSIYAPTTINAHTNETMSFNDRLSSIVDVIPTRNYLFSNPLLSAMTCLLPMHTQGKNTAHFRLLMDKIGVRRGLIGFSAIFIIDVTSGNPIHLRHL